jgi:hypothetical protein
MIARMAMVALEMLQSGLQQLGRLFYFSKHRKKGGGIFELVPYRTAYELLKLRIISKVDAMVCAFNLARLQQIEKRQRNLLNVDR